MVHYNYIKQVNSDSIYTNIISNVGVTPDFFSYDNITFEIKIGFEEALTAQQEIDLNATIDDYIYEEQVRVFSLLPIVDVDNSQYNVSYIGYGYTNACKIQKVTTNQTGYTSTWSEGSEVFDKIWSNRYIYSYF
jgi:hypothetical protein